MNLGFFMGIFKFYFSFLEEWWDDEDELVLMKISGGDYRDAIKRSAYGEEKLYFYNYFIFFIKDNFKNEWS